MIIRPEAIALSPLPVMNLNCIRIHSPSDSPASVHHFHPILPEEECIRSVTTTVLIVLIISPLIL